MATGKITTEEARALLDSASKSTVDARQVLVDAESTLASIDASLESRKRTAEQIAVTAASRDSLEDQWKAFQAKFDALNRALVGNVAASLGKSGMGGAAGRSTPDFISEERVAQVLRQSKNVVVLTGAGISAESGIPTFRGADGFWTVGSENYRPEELATWVKYDEMPQELWKWYQYRWGICKQAKPNPGHFALAELEQLIDGDFLLATQNIDGLHLLAGSDRTRCAEIHGRIDEMRCDERVEGACLFGVDLNDAANIDIARATVVKTPKPAAEEKDEVLPLCQTCGIRQRPKILWFDESYNEAFYKLQTVREATKKADVLLIIGTQLTTGLPSKMVSEAADNGTLTIRIDPEVDFEDSKSKGMLHLKGKSGDILPRIVAELRQLRKEPFPAPLATPPSSSPPGTPSRPSSARTPLPVVPVVPASGSRSPKAVPAVPVKAPPLRRATVALSGRGSSPSAVGRASISAAKASPPVPARPTRTLSPGRAKASSVSALRTSSPKSSAPGSAVRRVSSSGAVGRGSALTAAGSIALASKSASPNVSLPALVPSVGEPIGFFVYGTLRPDDDSGASWTKSFVEGMEAEDVILPGASLYVDGCYPAVNFEQTRCSVRGVFLTPAMGKMGAVSMASKLAEADKIEGYPDLYQRSVANVQNAKGQVRRAYVYHRTGLTKREECVRIADGDWLSRKR